MAGQIRQLHQAAFVPKQLRSIGTVDETIADGVALAVRMDDRQHAPAAAAVFEDNVGSLGRKVMPRELVVVLVALDNLGRRLAEEQGEKAEQGGLAGSILAGDGHMSAHVDFDGFAARIRIDEDEA